MDNKRRKFLKMAGATVLAGISAPALVKLSSTSAVASGGGGQAAPAAGHGNAGGHGEEQPSGVRLGMVIDMRQFYQDQGLLDEAIAACVKVHNVPQIPNPKSEIKWIWKTGFGNLFPEHSQKLRSEKIKNSQFPALCNHCDNPSCVKACPTKATFVVEKNGIVAMDFHRCIGCRFCMAACPYGARSFNFRDPQPFIAEVNKKFPRRLRSAFSAASGWHWDSNPPAWRSAKALGQWFLAISMIPIRKSGRCSTRSSPFNVNQLPGPNRQSST